MANQIIKYSYSTGELSPQFFGRSDIEQYDLGLAKAENWFVDFRGGLSNRPGLRFNEFMPDLDDEPDKLFNFSFSGDAEDNYILMFVENWIYFIQDGSYVLNFAANVSDITVDYEFHLDDDLPTPTPQFFKLIGFDGFDEVSESRLFKRRQYFGTVTDLLTLNKYPTADRLELDGYVGGGELWAVYAIEHPYDVVDLPLLRAYQHRDLIRLTHPDYPIMNLIRNDHTDWVLEEEDIGITRQPPGGLQENPQDTGNASIVWTVTAVLRNGEETRYAKPEIRTGIEDYSVTRGNVRFHWNRRPGAESYNVYRSAITHDPGDDISNGIPLGYIGNVKGTELLDSNIVPDYTKAPPKGGDPFAPGAIIAIEVTSGGGGHDNTTTIDITDPDGSGFVGYPIVSNGDVVGAVILNGGQGYTSPNVVFGGGGSGANADAEAGALTGTYPRVSAIFQQRQIYAGSDEYPLTIWGSRPTLYSNFSYSEITIDSDSYEFEIDSAKLDPIKHLESQRGGLLVMSNSGIWQLTGGNEAAVTPSNVLADPQTYTGVSDLKPLKVENNLIYVEGRGYGVRLLSYNEFSKVYSSDDKTTLSRHLFDVDKQIVDWCAATVPLRLVNCVRSDGQMLALTILAEEKVFAWTPWTTKGLFKNCVSVPEDQDRVYCVVRRYFNGQWVKTLESFAYRNFTTIEDAFFVDCGLSLDPSYATETATLAGTTLTSEFAVFPADCEGWVIRYRGGKLLITEYTSDTEVQVSIITAIPPLFEGAPIELPSGEWTLDEPTDTISGLWHLEGMEVVALVDGNVVEGLTVTDGSVTLPEAGTRVHIGLAYSAIARTLPPVVSDAVIEASRKRIVSIAARRLDTVGLEAGPSLDLLRELDGETNPLFDEALQPFTGLDPVWIDPQWDVYGQTYIVQSQPLPATLLGHVVDIEVGDDKQ